MGRRCRHPHRHQPGHRHSRHCHGGMGLRRVLFLWFLVAIIATGVSVGLVMAATTGDPWREEAARIQRFAAGRFDAVWDDPAERDDLVRAIESELEVDVELRDREGVVLLAAPCADFHTLRVPGKGSVRFCVPDRARPPWEKKIVAVLVALCVLMMLSGILARRLARPIRRVARVAEAIGEGDLSARVGTHHMPGEVGLLAETIDNMAGRIETHLREQKELLAGVSHEMRTPLGHVRLLLELAREGDPSAVDEMESEIDEMDALVGDLLARSRLDFENLDRRAIDPVDLARHALERQGLPAEKLDAPDSLACMGDPTLLARALANLIQNAEKHGGGLERLSVRREDREIVFVVSDAGPGFDEDAFEPFVTGPALPEGHARHPSLGLGLALTKRIAEAHDGRLDVSVREGAHVRMSIALHT